MEKPQCPQPRNLTALPSQPKKPIRDGPGCLPRAGNIAKESFSAVPKAIRLFDGREGKVSPVASIPHPI